MADDANLSEKVARLEGEKRALLSRVEGLLRDRARYENISDGQRRLLKRITEEYRDAEEKIHEQHDRVLELADSLNASLGQLKKADVRLQQEKNRRTEAEARADSSRDACGQELLERTFALVEANKVLRELPAKIIHAQEDERKCVAHDLHDSIVQTLGIVRIFLDNELVVIGDEHPEYNTGRLCQISEMVAKALEEVRRIMTNLRPSILDELGLKAALNWLVRETEKLVPDVAVEVHMRFTEQRLPEEKRIVIFRVTQEALANLRKHSRATQAELNVVEQGNNVLFTYNDNGVGMTGQQDISEGFGLVSMRERVELCGGTFNIRSTPDNGVGIHISLPLS